MMAECIPVTVQLLGSKVTSDVLEALEFLSTAFEFGVLGSGEGVRRGLVLVWSKEQQVREAVVAAYVRLYLNPEVRGEGSECGSECEGMGGCLCEYMHPYPQC